MVALTYFFSCISLLAISLQLDAAACRPRPTKPSVVLVPGAWHQPAHYYLLSGLLTNAGYSVSSKRNPSAGSDTPRDQSVAKDAASIRNNLILPEINAGKDVVVVAHSYGGCPASAAAKGLSKSERQAAGLPGGIVGLILVAAFVAPEGASLKSSLPGGQYDSWVKVDESTGQLTPENPKDVFYNDVKDALAQPAIKLILNQSDASLQSPSPPPAWLDTAFNGRRAYIKTLQDHCIPKVAQDAMVQYSGVEWDIREMNTSHSPFLSQPEQLSKNVIDFIQKYSA